MKLFYLIVFVFCVLPTACIAQKKRNKSKIPFKDDLIIYRISLDLLIDEQKNIGLISVVDTSAPVEKDSIAVSLAVNVALDTALHKMSDANGRRVRTTSGYQVVAYSGTDRSEADRIYSILESTLPDTMKLLYEQPNYKLKVGNYLTKVEAYKVCVQIREVYPLAIVVSARIVIDVGY